MWHLETANASIPLDQCDFPGCEALNCFGSDGCTSDPVFLLDSEYIYQSVNGSTITTRIVPAAPSIARN
jgi:hypothetical protein